MTHFTDIPDIPEALTQTLTQRGFTTMTPVQEQSIPAILQGRDLLAHAPTGSGKTLAFGIPSVMMTQPSGNDPATLVITPTRELAEQIAVSLKEVAAYKENFKIITLYGGVPLRTQADSLQKGAQLIIGTPGRILDHLSKGTLALHTVERLILDEADRMLDMGFYDDILTIVKKMKSKRQTLLFSATFPPKIKAIAKDLLHDPVMVSVGTETDKKNTIEEIVYVTQNRLQTLKVCIETYHPSSLLVFCNTKADVDLVTDRLQQWGHDAIALHGDYEQSKRQEAIIRFENKSASILVATDVASRGIDIAKVGMVLNYDLPFDEAVYTHRIGRTGRAGASGTAVSFYVSGSQKTDYIRQRAHEGRPLTAVTGKYLMQAPHATICLNGGKRQKLRKGDILGTFCKEIGLSGSQIGMITVMDQKSYIALEKGIVSDVLKTLKQCKIKKKRYIAWRVA
jgi:ATP-independent RNA helicase DbpA